MRDASVFDGESGRVMKDIVIYGSGGMALETVQLIEDINAVEPTWNILGYIDDFRGDQGEKNQQVNGYPILGTRSIVKDFDPSVYWVIAVSNPKSRREIHDFLREYPIRYAILIHPTAKICKNAKIGQGSIVSCGCILSVNAELGSQVYLNMRTVVGHDSVIQDFSTCLIGSIVAGNVLIGEGVLLGSGCIIKEKVTIGENTKVSMGAAVFFDVDRDIVVMNCPPKKMKFGTDVQRTKREQPK